MASVTGAPKFLHRIIVWYNGRGPRERGSLSERNIPKCTGTQIMKNEQQELGAQNLYHTMQIGHKEQEPGKIHDQKGKKKSSGIRNSLKVISTHYFYHFTFSLYEIKKLLTWFAFFWRN